LNGDGWTDLIVVDAGAMTWWPGKNPKSKQGDGSQHVQTPVTNNESPQFVDVDGDGKRDLLAAFRRTRKILMGRNGGWGHDADE